MTAWCREDETLLPLAFPLESRDVQLSPRILFTTPLKKCMVIEKRMLLRVRSASPPLYRCTQYLRWGRVVTVPDTAWKSHPLFILSSGRNSALS